MKVSWVVVPEKSLPPDAPGLSICQLRDRAVEEGDGGTTVVVVGDPAHSVVDAILFGVQEACANFVARRGRHFIVDFLHRVPDVVHVKLVRHSLERGPHRTQAVVVLADVVHDLVERLHGDRREVVPERIVGRVRDHLDVGVAVHVHGRHAVFLGGSGVELLESLHRHRVDGVCYRLVEVGGEAVLG